jgi:hypothetical protein
MLRVRAIREMPGLMPTQAEAALLTLEAEMRRVLERLPEWPRSRKERKDVDP